MSSRVAYTLAVVMLISPLIAIPSFIAYKQHQKNEVEKHMRIALAAEQANMEAARARANEHESSVH